MSRVGHTHNGSSNRLLTPAERTQVDSDAARTAGSPRIEQRSGERGFSPNELLIVVAILGILSVAIAGEMSNAIEKARLSACMANMVTIREMVWANSDGGMDFPEREILWSHIMRGSASRGYWYALDNDDANKGHGNDLDFFDEQNPGKAPRVDKNIYFVLRCEHNHGRLADYVYLEDEGPPQIAMGRDQPRWNKFYNKEKNGGG